MFSLESITDSKLFQIVAVAHPAFTKDLTQHVLSWREKGSSWCPASNVSHDQVVLDPHIDGQPHVLNTWIILNLFVRVKY